MGEPMCQLAVIREQQQPGRVGVEAPDMEQPLGTIRDELIQAGAPPVVGHGGHDSGRLVDHQDDKVLVARQ